MNAFDEFLDHPASDAIREVIVEEGSTCEHTNDDGPTIIVDVNGVAEAIVSRLIREGYLR
jgi:hypothetical protein